MLKELFFSAVEKVKEICAAGKEVATAAFVGAVAVATLLTGGVAEAQTAQPVSVDSMGIDITETATNFGTNLGTIILAVLGITMGIAVVKFFARWLGAKSAK